MREKKMISRRITVILFGCFCLFVNVADAQEITLQEADSLFLHNNLELLAARCNVSAADAEVAQAKLYANPVVSLQENVYNCNNRRFFDFGSKSEQVVDVDQMIYIAGQHANVVRMTKAGKVVAQREFDELLRNLRGEMHKIFIKLYFAQRNIKMYQNEILSLSQVLDALVTQEKKGNISRVETGRIQALLLSLRQEQDDFMESKSELEGHLRLFLSLPFDVQPTVTLDVDCIDSLLDMPGSMPAIEKYLADRSDVLLAESNKRLAQASLKVERSKAWPEVHITGQYDRNAGYFPNYFALGVTMSVPLFNRNQGNIKRAKNSIEKCQLDYQNALSKAQNEAEVAIENFRRNVALVQSIKKDLDKTDLEGLFQSINDNYRQRNISLLEFVDYYNTYKNTQLAVSSVKENTFLAVEELNCVLGKDIIKY